MKRSLAILSFFAGLLTGCDGVVETSEVGRVEVQAQLECYRWGTSVLRSSRTAANPDFVAFSDGVLHYVGTPGAYDVQRTLGRSGVEWTTSMGGVLDGFIADVVPHPEGGLVAVSSADGLTSIGRVDADGEASLVSRIAADSLADEDYAYGEQIAAFTGGYVLASLEMAPGVSTELIVRKLDQAGEVMWTRGAAVTPEEGWAFQYVRVHVSEEGLISAVVNDQGARSETDIGGVRLLQWNADGDPVEDRSFGLEAHYVDVAFRGDGGLTLLSTGFDYLELRHLDATLQTLWLQTPREGADIRGNALMWDAHTDRLLVLAESRGGGTSTGWFLIYTPDGELEWSHRAKGDVGGATSSLVADPAGGFVMPDWRAEMRVRQFLPTGC